MPLSCKGYIVVDHLSFYKMRIVTYSIFQLQYHGSIPWVDFTIPWADAIYNTMGKFHGSMNNMGG